MATLSAGRFLWYNDSCRPITGCHSISCIVIGCRVPTRVPWPSGDSPVSCTDCSRGKRTGTARAGCLLIESSRLFTIAASTDWQQSQRVAAINSSVTTSIININFVYTCTVLSCTQTNNATLRIYRREGNSPSGQTYELIFIPRCKISWCTCYVWRYASYLLQCGQILHTDLHDRECKHVCKRANMAYSQIRRYTVDVMMCSAKRHYTTNQSDYDVSTLGNSLSTTSTRT